MLTLSETCPVMVTPLAFGLEEVECSCGASYQIRSGWRELWCPECENWVISDALVAG